MKHILFLFLCSTLAFSQTITEDEFYSKDLPNFALYEDTYFITGIPLNENITKKTADVKYNISFSQLLTKKSILWGSFVYLSYTQKAFWDVYDNSSPFKEINFNPGVAIAKPFWKKDGHLTSILELKAMHESNGRDSIYSRSWNRISASYKQSFTEKLQAELKVWTPVMSLSDNPDIMQYMGYGELIVDYDFIPKVLSAEVKLNRSFEEEGKGAFRGRVFVRVGEKTNQYIMVEYYNGYGENLINYDQHTHMIRIGYALKSRWDDLFKSKKYRD
ncbi:MAG: phospholipase A [Weeksellaceae bacterium]